MEEKRLYVGNDGTVRREGSEDAPEQGTKCSTCSKKSEPCISFFAYENSMMHKDMDNERAHKTTLFVCLAFVLIVVIFVTAYTIRTNIWLDTISKLNAAIVELANAKGIITP